MYPNDLLSSLFEVLRLNGVLSFVAELRPTQAVAVPAEARIVRFHLVRRGTCSVEIPGADDVRLGPGDLVLVPHGRRQVLRGPDAGREAAIPLSTLLDDGALREGVLSDGEGPATVSLLCGYCRFDPDVDHPMLGALPPVMVLRKGDAGADPWVAAALRLLTLEADRLGPGVNAVLTRTVEIVFIQTVRAMAARAHGGLDDEGTSYGDTERRNLPESADFLAALADRRLARALDAIHRAPADPWTLETLAKAAGMSRAVFAERFARQVGLPPATYLARWRLLLARDLLRHPALSTADVAERIGYGSPAAFARRFKAVYGLGPGAFRRQRIGTINGLLSRT